MTSDSDTPVFSKLPQASLAQQALKSIRQAIISGHLKPRQLLRETELASQMGVSRAPVREALLILEEECLVERVPNKGTFVTSFSQQDVEELYSLRMVLECFGVELLIEHMDDEDIQNLWAIVDKMRKAAREDNADQVNSYDMQFHEYMMARSGHKRLLDMWQGLKFQIRRVVIAANILNENLDTIAENHVPILEALETRDVTEAKRLIRQHVSDSGKRYIANWEQIQNLASSEHAERNT